MYVSVMLLLQLMDLVMLDEGCLEFPYGILAATVLYHFGSESVMQKASGKIKHLSVLLVSIIMTVLITY